MKTVEEILDGYGIEYEDFNAENYKILCPFHDDHTPSLNITKDEGIFYCWSCKASGSLISFVRDYEKISYEEAKKKVMGSELVSFTYKKKPKKDLTLNEKYYEIVDLMRLLLYAGVSEKRKLKLMCDNFDTPALEKFYDRYKKVKNVEFSYDLEMKKVMYEYITEFIDMNCFEDKYEEFVSVCPDYYLGDEMEKCMGLMGDSEYKEFKYEQTIVPKLTLSLYNRLKSSVKNFDKKVLNWIQK